MKSAQLKEIGHQLLEEYKTLAGVNGTQAYADLEKRMKGKTPHFGNMKQKKDVMLAIGTLKKMLYPYKNK